MNFTIELSGVFKISNDEAGFEAFEKWKHELMVKHDKSRSIVGMEPTGHYWFNFGYSLKKNCTKVVLVNPMHVKRCKEFDDNSQLYEEFFYKKVKFILTTSNSFIKSFRAKEVLQMKNINKKENLWTNLSAEKLEKREEYIHLCIDCCFKVCADCCFKI